MEFRLPKIDDKEVLQEYVQEHYDNQEYGISASMGLTACEYADWLEKIHRNASVGDAQWGRCRTCRCCCPYSSGRSRRWWCSCLQSPR